MPTPPTKTDRIRFDVARHPGATTKDIAQRTGIDPNTVSAITGAEAKAGRMRREVASSTISNVKVYAYWSALGNVSKPLENVSKPSPRPAAKPHSKPAAGLDALLDQVAGAIALELTSRIRERLADELQQVLPTTAPTRDPVRLLDEITRRIALNAPAAPKDRLDTALIVGLLPAQAGMIQSEFHDAFDLKFWQDGPPSQLKDLVRGADHVITFSGKLGHHVEETIKSTGKSFVRIMGGMTQLRDTLTTIYVKEDGCMKK